MNRTPKPTIARVADQKTSSLSPLIAIQGRIENNLDTEYDADAKGKANFIKEERKFFSVSAEFEAVNTAAKPVLF